MRPEDGLVAEAQMGCMERVRAQGRGKLWDMSFLGWEPSVWFCLMSSCLNVSILTLDEQDKPSKGPSVSQQT